MSEFSKLVCFTPTRFIQANFKVEIDMYVSPPSFLLHGLKKGGEFVVLLFVFLEQ